jgi:hypothetical protein
MALNGSGPPEESHYVDIIRGARLIFFDILSAAASGLPKAGRGGLLQKQGAKWSDSAPARADGRPLGGLRQTNRFPMSRTRKMGVKWGRFQGQKGDSGSDQGEK